MKGTHRQERWIALLGLEEHDTASGLRVSVLINDNDGERTCGHNHRSMRQFVKCEEKWLKDLFDKGYRVVRE